MRMIHAFIIGIKEFRLSCTTIFDAYEEQLAYDYGRSFAHVVTLRHFDN